MKKTLSGDSLAPRATQFRLGRYKIRRAGGPHLQVRRYLIEVADVSGLGSRRSGSCDSRAHALRCAREWPLCMPSPSMLSTFRLSPLSPLFFSFLSTSEARIVRHHARFLQWGNRHSRCGSTLVPGVSPGSSAAPGLGACRRDA
jgi:hypothetical protein